MWHSARRLIVFITFCESVCKFVSLFDGGKEKVEMKQGMTWAKTWKQITGMERKTRHVLRHTALFISRWVRCRASGRAASELTACWLGPKSKYNTQTEESMSVAQRAHFIA
jgi:integrase